MSAIESIPKEVFVDMQNRIFEQLVHCETLGEAAQKYTALMVQHFGDSMVLCRVFVTQEFDKLPVADKASVTTIAENKGVADKLRGTTLILSLLGTQGVNPQWNDRRNSRGHVGVPLVTSDFVAQIPMISRLLKALGLGLDWIDSHDNDIIGRTIGNMGGVFHVSDARTERDTTGRLIISAQDFVKEYGVLSVFGVGGGYIGSPMFFTVITFLRETISRETAAKFLLHASKFKAATIRHVQNGTIF
jgi:hypothetical protein